MTNDSSTIPKSAGVSRCISAQTNLSPNRPTSVALLSCWRLIVALFSGDFSVVLIVSLSQKNSKLAFYLKGLLSRLVPNQWFRQQLPSLLELGGEGDLGYIEARVAYYNKRQAEFVVGGKAKTLLSLSSKQQSAYYYDLRGVLRYFPRQAHFHHEFGDVIKVPEFPCILKSRPIAGDNHNSILLKLNSVRHYVFVKDGTAFIDKKPMVVWRGKAKPNHPRSRLVQDWFRHPRCDVGQSNKPPIGDNPRKRKDTLSIEEQLQFRYIISVEGNDVATNLKWIMSSNSLCFMPKPRYETWFMEGQLQAGVHYVQLKNDFTDIEEHMDYYNANPSEALAIIANANRWVEQFKNANRERMISLLVMQKYLELSGQSGQTQVLVPSQA